MRIALVYDAVFPYVKGGAEKRYYEIARRLAQRHEVHLFGMKYWPGRTTDVDENGIIRHGVCPAHELYVHGKRTISQPIRYSAALLPHLFAEKFDVIDCASFPYFSMFVCKVCAVARCVPLVATWLEYWGDYWFEYLGWLGRFGKLTERAASRLPDQIIAISELTRQGLLATGVNSQRIRVIPLGIDAQAIKRAPISDIASDVIYVGRLIDFKGVGTLIRAIALLNHSSQAVRCCVVGAGPERASLEALAQQTGMQDSVRFVGPQEPEQVYGFMKASKVLALPSLREGFGMVLVEANACGLPAITIDCSTNAGRELIADGRNGYLAAPNAESLAQAIGNVLGNAAHRHAMQDAAVQMAGAFTWDSITAQVEELYRNLVYASQSPFEKE